MQIRPPPRRPPPETLAPDRLAVARTSLLPTPDPRQRPGAGSPAGSRMPRQTGLHRFPGNAGAPVRLGLGATLVQFSKMPLWNDGIDIGVNDAVPEKANEFETLGGVETLDVELLQGRTHDCLQ